MDRIDVGGYRLAYRRGGSDAGAPVLFLSALGTPGSDWWETIDLLGEPFQWLVYNRAGIGCSDARPETATHGYRVRTDELVRLVDALNFPTPAVIVGHSIGALIARDLATIQPVLGLVLVESSFDGLTPTPTDGPFRLYDGQELLDPADGEADLAGEQPPQIPAAVVSVSQQPGRWPDENPVPAEQWHANQDRLAALYGAQHFLSEAGGHLLTEEDPALIARAVTWVVRRARELPGDDGKPPIAPVGHGVGAQNPGQHR